MHRDSCLSAEPTTAPTPAPHRSKVGLGTKIRRLVAVSAVLATWCVSSNAWAPDDVMQGNTPMAFTDSPTTP